MYYAVCRSFAIFGLVIWTDCHCLDLAHNLHIFLAVCGLVYHAKHQPRWWESTGYHLYNLSIRLCILILTLWHSIINRYDWFVLFVADWLNGGNNNIFEHMVGCIFGAIWDFFFLWLEIPILDCTFVYRYDRMVKNVHTGYWSLLVQLYKWLFLRVFDRLYCFFVENEICASLLVINFTFFFFGRSCKKYDTNPVLLVEVTKAEMK